jgi:chromate reductase, NAD(P)H dehydrogenase (quinone)
MDPLRIGVFVGSLRKDSYNRRLALALEKLAPGGLRFEHIRIDDLPLYNQDFDADYPPVCRRLKQAIQACDGLIFVTPEYNRSVPGVLKNAIDIASRPYGASAFAGKPAAVCGASVGSIGTAIAQQHLRNTLAYLDVPTLGQPEVFIYFTENLIAPDGEINNPGTAEFLQGFVDRFVDWVKRFGTIRTGRNG